MLNSSGSWNMQFSQTWILWLLKPHLCWLVTCVSVSHRNLSEINITPNFICTKEIPFGLLMLICDFSWTRRKKYRHRRDFQTQFRFLRLKRWSSNRDLNPFDPRRIYWTGKSLKLAPKRRKFCGKFKSFDQRRMNTNRLWVKIRNICLKNCRFQNWILLVQAWHFCLTTSRLGFFMSPFVIF